MPSPPLSPPLAAQNVTASKVSTSDFADRSGRARRGGAAYTITGECERLFCETLRAVFLGEGNLARQDSLVLGMHKNSTDIDINDYGIEVQHGCHDLPSPQADGFIGERGIVSQWVEVWDYVGGVRFRGFVVDEDGEKAMFVFFDQGVIDRDLKPGLMALLELCDLPYFACSRLVVCLDRENDIPTRDALSKDLGWIGFDLTTLADWTEGDEITSTKWLLMSMDV